MYLKFVYICLNHIDADNDHHEKAATHNPDNQPFTLIIHILARSEHEEI